MARAAEDLLREIARIESDIEELLDYRGQLQTPRPELDRWARFKRVLEYVLAAKQIERHLRCLRLELQIAHDSLQNLQKAEHQRSV
jgi:hypothetical protein